MKFNELNKTRGKVAIGGVLAGLALLAVTSGPISAQTPEPAPGNAPTHEQMHQMMDAMHGEGASQRMHEAMGPQAEEMMDQCTSMMGNGMSGMMGGQNGQSMQNMMRGMMGR
jgi:hypothetical protein